MDVLLTTAPDAPRPWGELFRTSPWPFGQIEGARLARTPIASSVAAQVVLAREGRPFHHALLVESLAYSTSRRLGVSPLAEPETPRASAPGDDGPAVKIERDGAVLKIVLSRPAKRNALSAAMRDGLCHALAWSRWTPASSGRS